VTLTAHSISALRKMPRMLLVPALVCALALGAAAQAWSATPATTTTTGQGEGTQTKANPSATLEECLATGTQAERAATFEGEMAVVAGAVRMEMRINVLEKLPHEVLFHTVSAPGLGVWRRSALGVKTYTYLKQVTNLSAPAIYRGAVEFRWLNDKGRPIKSALLLTTRCHQPLDSSSETAPPSTEPQTKAPSETPTGTGTTTTATA
jgi:hypothetical protein